LHHLHGELFCSLLAVASFHYPRSKLAPMPEKDPVLKAMLEELDRSKK